MTCSGVLYLHEHSLNLSDHSAIYATLDLGNIPLVINDCVKSKAIRWGKMSKADRDRLYAVPLYPMVDSILHKITLCAPSPEVIDDAFSDLTKCIMTVSERLPKKRFKKHLKPFWNAELSRLKRSKMCAYRDWVPIGRPRGYEDRYFCEYKSTIKAFSGRLRYLSKEYENEEILRAVKLAEVDRNSFWRLVKQARGNRGAESISIRNGDNKIVYESKAILDVWKNHFETLGTPKADPHFDDAHYQHVVENVHAYNDGL